LEKQFLKGEEDDESRIYFVSYTCSFISAITYDLWYWERLVTLWNFKEYILERRLHESIVATIVRSLCLTS